MYLFTPIFTTFSPLSHSFLLSFEAEQAELERRRNLTDAERAREDAADPTKRPKERSKHEFMQAYYHKGAFYQEETGVNSRAATFDAPTEKDRVQKEFLPKPMQVKNFGRMSQTKYTHLADQDTTKRDSAWAQKSAGTQAVVKKLGGIKDKDVFHASAKRRRTDA